MSFRITFDDGVVFEMVNCDNIIDAINQSIEISTNRDYGNIAKVERI